MSQNCGELTNWGTRNVTLMLQFRQNCLLFVMWDLWRWRGEIEYSLRLLTILPSSQQQPAPTSRNEAVGFLSTENGQNLGLETGAWRRCRVARLGLGGGGVGWVI